MYYLQTHLVLCLFFFLMVRSPGSRCTFLLPTTRWCLTPGTIYMGKPLILILCQKIHQMLFGIYTLAKDHWIEHFTGSKIDYEKKLPLNRDTPAISNFLILNICISSSTCSSGSIQIFSAAFIITR
mmetsp:Transcript_24497/g.55951  ORF Transcript_24497/g.55951 Transcript_24497/m.55951 type:complete len:126 (+) Transcript_24497:1445-1822(+)